MKDAPVDRKCCVPMCQNVEGKVRGRTMILRSSLGEQWGWICEPCCNFMLTGQDLYSTLARNGRRRPKGK